MTLIPKFDLERPRGAVLLVVHELGAHRGDMRAADRLEPLQVLGAPKVGQKQLPVDDRIQLRPLLRGDVAVGEEGRRRPALRGRALPPWTGSRA